MYSDIDILEFLINLVESKEVEYDDYLCIYESHMGGFYTTSSPLSMDDCYCEQCGDSDWEIACGWCADLIFEFSKKVLDMANDIHFLFNELALYMTMDDAETWLSQIAEYHSENEGEDGDCDDQICPTTRFHTISDVLDSDLPLVCKKCKMIETLAEIWR